MKDYLPNLEPGQVAFLRDVSTELALAAPQSDYQPYVSGGHFDQQECLDALRDEATADGCAILEAVVARIQRKRWPRLTKRAKAFVSLRLFAAADYCRAWLVAHRLPANTPRSAPPKDWIPALGAIVSDYWDDTGCDSWVQENASCIERPFDWYSEDEQRRMDGY